MTMPNSTEIIRRRGFLAGLSIVLGVAVFGPAASQTPAGEAEPAVMLVLDGSGSMWGKIGKEQKINAVRDVLKLAIPKAPPMSLGLTAFGHRRTGDCSDVEVVVQPASGSGERLLAVLEKFNPKGKGPIGNAIKAAAETLAEKSPKDARRSLIVVADNADNCKIDTCELAQELRQSQPNLVIHVIALGVSKEETQSLACLASASGGRLFKADQVSDVASAVEQSFKLATGPIVVAPALPAAPAKVVSIPEPPKPAPTGPPGLQLTALLAAGGAEIASGIRWRITAGDANVKANERRVVYEGEDRNPDVDLPSGTYRIEATFGLASVEQAVTVGAAGRTQARVPLNAAIINVKDSGARNGASTDRVFYTLYTAASGAGKGSGGPGEKPRAIALSSDQAPVYNVAAGTYLIAVQQGLARIERSVTVPPGAITDVDIPLYLGELKLSAVANDGGPPLDRVVFQVFEDDPDAPGGLRELVRSSAAQPEFSLPAGAYLVVARQDGAEARERVSVKPGTRLTRALILASGRLTLSAKLPARAPGRLDADLLSYRIERMNPVRAPKADLAAAPAGKSEPASEEVSRTHAPELALALTAGKYRVEGRYGAINARSRREIEVKAGVAQAVVLELDAGLVTLKVLGKPVTGTMARAGPGAAASAALADVFWEIAEPSGRVIWSTSQGAPRLPLAAGRYLARVETRTGTAEQAFQVTGGDDKTVEIELQ